MNEIIENTLQVFPALSSHNGIAFLAEHLQLANVLTPTPKNTRKIKDKEFISNESFWDDVLNEKTRALNWIVLNNFQIVDWYPRSPGVYHTDKARSLRSDAEKYYREENGIYFYEPHGKRLMINGGVGSVRFKSLKIDNEDCWLGTATSDGYCHSGVPLVIPNRIVEVFGFDTTIKFNLYGQIRFLPDFFEKTFSHLSDVPQVYVFIEKLEKVSSAKNPVFITPTVFFTSKLREHYHNEGLVTYVRCQSSSRSAINQAIHWLEDYTTKYDGDIITNFDQQRSAFRNAPFSLQNLMEGSIHEDALQNLRGYHDKDLLEAIKKAREINFSIYISEANMGDINISGGDFRGSILNINSTLTHVKQSINSADLESRTKEALLELIDKLNKELQKAPKGIEEDADYVAESAKSFVETATKESPNPKMIEIKGEGLKKAAENIAQILPNVLNIALQILAFFKP